MLYLPLHHEFACEPKCHHLNNHSNLRNRYAQHRSGTTLHLSRTLSTVE
jgi:hypothetical protein